MPIVTPSVSTNPAYSFRFIQEPPGHLSYRVLPVMGSALLGPLYLIHVDIQVMADAEAVRAVGVDFALGQPRHLGTIDAEDHVIALGLDAQGVGLLAVRALF